jgi:hypothetical protein
VLFTDSTILSGLSSLTATKFLLLLGFRIDSKKEFYQAQQLISSEIHVLAQKSVDRAREQLVDGGCGV